MPRFQGINGYIAKMNIDNVLKWILVVAAVAASISIRIATTTLLLLFPKHKRQGHHVQQPRQGHKARDDKARGIPCFGRGQRTRQPIKTQTRHDLTERGNGTPKGETNEDAPITSAVLPCMNIPTREQASKQAQCIRFLQTNKQTKSKTKSTLQQNSI